MSFNSPPPPPPPLPFPPPPPTTTNPITPTSLSLSPHRIPSLPPTAYYLPNFLTTTEESTLIHHITTQPLPKWRILSNRRLQAHPSELSKTHNVLLKQELPAWLMRPCVERMCAMAVVVTGRSPEEGQGNGEGSGDEVEEEKEEGEEGEEDEGRGEGIFANTPHASPNHCLVNEYRPGQGIMPHEDGDAYAPVVCTVSLGGHGVLDLYNKERQLQRQRQQQQQQQQQQGDRLRPQSGDDDHHDEEGARGEGGEGKYEEGKAGRSEEANHPDYRILYEPRSLLVTTGELYTEYTHGIASVKVDEGICAGEDDHDDNDGDDDGDDGSTAAGGEENKGAANERRKRRRSTRGTGIANWDLLGDKGVWERNGGTAERTTRWSLTFRDVRKVKDLGGLMMVKGGKGR